MPNAVWDITSLCNLSCKHCYNSEKYAKQAISDLSYDECMELIAFLKRSGCDKIALLGGEPLMHPHITEVLRICKKNNISVAITTNGIMLDDDMISHILESSVTSILISLDGTDAQTNDSIRGDGVFDIVTSNASNLVRCINAKNSNISAVLACTIFSTNAHLSKELVNLCKRLNIINLNLTPLIDSGGASKNWDSMKLDNFKMFDAIEEIVKYALEIYPSLNVNIEARPWVIWYLKNRYPVNVTYSLGHTKCNVLNGLLYIKADGDLHPCGVYAFELGKKAQKKGYFNSEDTFNIRSINEIGEIYRSKYYTDFLSSMKALEKDNYHSNCHMCPVKDDCYPCPYQFINGVPDCDWASEKIRGMMDNISKWTVLSKTNAPSKLIPDCFHRSAYDLLKIDAAIEENHTHFLRNTDENINLLGYIEILNGLEKKFLIKTGRE